MLFILKTTRKAGGVTPDAFALEPSGGDKSRILEMSLQGIGKPFVRIGWKLKVSGVSVQVSGFSDSSSSHLM